LKIGVDALTRVRWSNERIKGVEQLLPPLRDKKADIPLLSVYFVLEHRCPHERMVTEIAKETLEKLFAYDWPGNIRQLENEIKSALAMGDGHVLRPEEFKLTETRITNTIAPYVSLSQPNDSDSGGHCNNRTKKKRIEEFRAILEQNPGLNTEQLAQIVGCHHRTIERYLDELQDLVISQKNPSDRRHVGYYLNDEQYRTN